MRSFFTHASRRLLAAAAMSLAAAGSLRADEVTDWHEHMLVALGKAGVNPVVSSRDAALVSAAVFDAVNGVERRYAPIHVTAAAPRGASKRAAAVQAAYVVLRARFPAQEGELDAKRNASLAAIGDGASQERGVAWGQSVADAILAWRSGDGFATALPPYVGGDAHGQWRPTPPGNAPGAGVQFASMTPWGISSPDQFLPPGPPALASEEYLADFNEAKSMGSAASALRTADQTDACLFWASTGPNPLWTRAAIELAAARGFELSDNARLLAMLNLAIADATIACWNAKYAYEFWRPITAIRSADADGNSATIEDPAWTPLVPTPAHPEYASGHSSAAGAATTVLASYFGADAAFVLRSATTPGWVRYFPNVSAATSEVAEARIFGGIHFRTACNDGLTLGNAVGTFLLSNRMQRLHGDGE